jgi:L-2-hydroxyglutarate oxidase
VDEWDVAIIGGGIVGLAAARAVLERRKLALVVLEAEPALARHQSSHNSGVIHSGLYYAPGSLKARLCVEGRKVLESFCRARGVPFETCGKLVVATRTPERARLAALHERGEANGLRGLRRLEPAEFRAIEPHVGGIEALHVPETGIVDFARVTEALAEDVRERGGTILTGARVTGVRGGGGPRPPFELETALGTQRCRALVACCGVQSDRVARAFGLRPPARIVPFRGEYWRLVDSRRHLVRHLVYPVPDPGLPFLGLHFTRRFDGEVEAGPSAVLALARDGYRRGRVRLGDCVSMAAWPGSWAMAARFLPLGLGELWRSRSRRASASALRRLVPELRSSDIEPGRTGVRAQAVDARGRLLDDFLILRGPAMVHVLNAPSPAATAALAIGRTIAEELEAVSVA